MKKKIYILFGIVFLFLIIGCPKNNPVETTAILPYAPPILTDLHFYQNSISVNLKSIVEVDDFVGYNIYLSTNKNLIDNIEANKLEDYKEFSNKPGFLLTKYYTSTEYPQELTLPISNILIGQTYFLAATCLGSNTYYAQLYDNYGFFESLPSEIIKFIGVKQESLILNNYSFTNNQSGLIIGLVGTSLSDVALIKSSITNTLYLAITNIGQGIGFYFFSGVGERGIQDLGYSSDFDLVKSLPQDGYKTNGIRIYKNHIYALKDNYYYGKIQVTNEIPVPLNNSEQVSLKIRIKYHLQPNENNL